MDLERLSNCTADLCLCKESRLLVGFLVTWRWDGLDRGWEEGQLVWLEQGGGDDDGGGDEQGVKKCSKAGNLINSLLCSLVSFHSFPRLCAKSLDAENSRLSILTCDVAHGSLSFTVDEGGDFSATTGCCSSVIMTGSSVFFVGVAIIAVVGWGGAEYRWFCWGMGGEGSLSCWHSRVPCTTGDDSRRFLRTLRRDTKRDNLCIWNGWSKEEEWIIKEKQEHFCSLLPSNKACVSGSLPVRKGHESTRSMKEGLRRSCF